jgi:hypothetical protein
MLIIWLLACLALNIERLYRLRYLHRGTHRSRSSGELVLALWVNFLEGSFVPGLVADLFHGPRNSVRDIFLTRSLRAVEGLKSLDEKDLLEAVKAPTD